MVTNKFTEIKGYYGYYYYSGNDITEHMIDKCFELDRKFFKEEFLYDENRVKEWLKTYNEMCSVLYNPDEDKVIAYCFYLFISDEALELYKANKISFFTMGSSLFVKPQKGENINLFCLSDACMPGWDYIQLHRIMNEYNVYNLYDLALKNGIKVKNVSIDVVCDYDYKLVKQFYINENIKTNHNSFFYWGRFDPNKTWTYCKYSSKLILEYNK